MPTVEEPTPTVFISYSRRDGGDNAEQLDDALRAAGFETWRDTRNIDPTKDFTAEIENGIESSTHVVVCITQDSKRRDSFVRREIHYALLSDKPVIPLRFADIVPHISIVTHDWIDFFRNWDTSFGRLRAILNNAADEYRQHRVSDDPFQHYLESLYKRIKDWLQGVIISTIDLSIADAPTAVAPREYDLFDQFLIAQGMGDVSSEKLSFTDFGSAFNYYNGRVLLLGEPGAGKTITLMAYVRDAITARLDDSDALLPLYGLIPTWDAQKQPLLWDWLATGHRDLAPAIREAVENGRSVLFLDALDELGPEREDPQTKEQYDPRQRFLPLLPPNNRVVVTCRIKDYGEIGQKIALDGAVTLQPLDDMQMREYLREMPYLWEALEADEELRNVARTPLLLSLFAFAYRDQGEEAAKLRNLRGSPGDLRDKIFETYVNRRYDHEARKPHIRALFTLEDIYDVLGRVAMESIVKWLSKDNLVQYGDFVVILNHGLAEAFIELVMQLHLLAHDQNVIYRFIHLSLRDYFAFDYSLLHLHDITRYGKPQWNNPAFALGQLGDVRAVEPLVATLNNDNKRIRCSAADALGLLGDARAVGPLIAALKDEDGSLKFSAATALERIGTPEALAAVEQWRKTQSRQE